MPPQGEIKAVETRIDVAHPVVDQAEALPVEAEERGEGPGVKGEGADQAEAIAVAADEKPVADPAEAVARQVRTQAAQLAEHLRARQKELDHREAALNARAAQLDRDARVARLWLNERMAELEDKTEPECPDVSAQEESLRRIAESLEVRQGQIEESETRLAAERGEVQRLHQQWTEDRQRLEQEGQAQRERLAAQQQRELAELDEKRRALAHRNELVDQSQAALEQLRQELGRMHRETLEIRLATEELWVQLSGAAPPAALTRSLGRIRSKLADHYRLSNAELHQRTQELEKVRRRMAAEYEKLLRQKRQFDQWTAECRDEVEQQAARLLVRGEELDRRETDYREQSRGWQTERLEMQQEVRRLRAKVTARAEAMLPV